MENWKKILLRAAGFGGGFAIVGAIILGCVIWWANRPVKPKPWNQNAVTATYEGVVALGDENKISAYYTLHNNTDTDYRLDKDSDIHLGFLTKKPQAMDFNVAYLVAPEFPVYVPARNSARMIFRLQMSVLEKEKSGASDDEQHDYNTRVAQFVDVVLSNTSGLVLLDEATRYQINFPNGWSERAKLSMKVKAPDTSK